jgi:RHS repeat-associated protein
MTDHAGTPYKLIDSEGKTIWEADADDWGAVRNEKGIRQPIRFQGQYHDGETGRYYNRWRYYDPLQGRYITQDPIGLAGGMNNFVYPNNPVDWSDPLGLIVVFASGTTNAEQADYNKAVRYLRKSAEGRRIIDTLEKSSTTYTILFNNIHDDRFIPTTNTIRWDPHSALTCTGTGSSGSQSPAMGLLHEMDHAIGLNPALAVVPDPAYGNLEEKRVIEGSERRAIQQLNQRRMKDHNRLEGVRHNHDGSPHHVSTPISVN